MSTYFNESHGVGGFISHNYCTMEKNSKRTETHKIKMD